MKMFLKTATLAGAFFIASSVFADEQTVALVVKNMTCASCPYIVKQSLAAVPGVSTVTANNGFPSEVLE